MDRGFAAIASSPETLPASHPVFCSSARVLCFHAFLSDPHPRGFGPWRFAIPPLHLHLVVKRTCTPPQLSDMLGTQKKVGQIGLSVPARKDSVVRAILLETSGLLLSNVCFTPAPIALPPAGSIPGKTPARPLPWGGRERWFTFRTCEPFVFRLRAHR